MNFILQNSNKIKNILNSKKQKLSKAFKNYLKHTFTLTFSKSLKDLSNIDKKHKNKRNPKNNRYTIIIRFRK